MRTIARIDIKNESVIKGINLEGLRKVGDPIDLAKKYYSEGIDELLIIDSVASLYGRNNLFELIKKITNEKWEPYKFCGREKTNLNVINWIDTIQNKGCGEILLTSIDKDGTETGFDIELINAVYQLSHKPLIVSGGCGKLDDIKIISKKFKNVSVALASVLHYKTIKISEIKNILK